MDPGWPPNIGPRGAFWGALLTVHASSAQLSALRNVQMFFKRILPTSKKKRISRLLYSLDVMAQEFVPGRTTGLSEFSKFISEIMFRNLNYIAKLILWFFSRASLQHLVRPDSFGCNSRSCRRHPCYDSPLLWFIPDRYKEYPSWQRCTIQNKQVLGMLNEWL